MTDYMYSISFTDCFGHFNKITCGTEEQMFASALAVWAENGDLLTAERSVWEVSDGVAHCVRVEPYRMGKPVEAEAVWL